VRLEGLGKLIKKTFTSSSRETVSDQICINYTSNLSFSYFLSGYRNKDVNSVPLENFPCPCPKNALNVNHHF
jgi:hypothetical protein